MGQQTKKEAVQASIMAKLAQGGHNRRMVYYDGKIHQSIDAFSRATKITIAEANKALKLGSFNDKPVFHVDSEKSLDNKKKIYDSCVAIAKKLIGEMEAIQFKIASLAIEACTIRHGGISTGIYTLRDFSRDIGMNEKTVQNYVRIYRSGGRHCATEKSAKKRAKLAIEDTEIISIYEQESS